MNALQYQDIRPISSRNVTDIVADIVVRRARELSGETVTIAEVGAGNGALAQMLCRRLEEIGITYRYDCFDIEPQQINSRELGFACRYLDAQQPFACDHKYDIVISVELIEHVENPFHLMREIASIALPGATVVVTTPNTLNLRSRWRHFMSGCYDYFRRPYNEYWLNMGHLNPISPIQLNYMARKNGFRVIEVRTNRYTLGAVMLTPFLPLMYGYSCFHYLAREKGRAQRQRNGKLLAMLFRPSMLFGKIAILEMRKEDNGVATPESWHRPDNRFAA